MNEMNNKIIINVAPVAADVTRCVPEQVAEDVIRCAELGATMVHLHVRDEKGSLTEDTSYLVKTLELIRKESNIVIEASTGGVSKLNIQQRCAPLSLDLVEFCSLNVGSVNLGPSVYANPIGEVKYCVGEIVKTGKIPEVEVFEIGMIHTMQQLQEEFDLPLPLLYSIVLGHEGAMPATEKALRAMIDFMPEDSIWGITHAHRSGFDLMRLALNLGACSLRIGFEDSDRIDSSTRVQTNAELVEHALKIMHEEGKQPMAPEEMRQFFGIGV